MNQTSSPTERGAVQGDIGTAQYKTDKKTLDQLGENATDRLSDTNSAENVANVESSEVKANHFGGDQTAQKRNEKLTSVSKTEDGKLIQGGHLMIKVILLRERPLLVILK